MLRPRSCSDRSLFPVSVQTDRNSSRASLDKQSPEQSKPHTNHSTIDSHADTGSVSLWPTCRRSPTWVARDTAAPDRSRQRPWTAPLASVAWVLPLSHCASSAPTVASHPGMGPLIYPHNPDRRVSCSGPHFSGVLLPILRSHWAKLALFPFSPSKCPFVIQKEAEPRPEWRQDRLLLWKVSCTFSRHTWVSQACEFPLLRDLCLDLGPILTALFVSLMPSFLILYIFWILVLYRMWSW